MESYIHLYKTNSEFTEAYNGPDYVEPWLSLTEDNMTIGYNKPKLIDFSTEPLTFNILSAGTINWTASNSAVTKTIDYKINDGGWTSITSNIEETAPSITVNPVDKLQFRGNNTQYGIDSAYNSFGGSALFESEGNIMSLIYGDNFKNNLTISSTYTFASLFSDCVNLVSAENLILPATTLTDGCYAGMFMNCTSLTTAPSVLPATTLANSCYLSMFQNCTKLTTAPKELPATTLEDSCYRSMFDGCTSLTTAPKELPATTLADSCYYYMFMDCTSLTTAPELPAITLAERCYYSMFQGCTSLTTAPALPATTLANSCYSYMFNGTNVLPDCSNIDFASSTVVASGGLKGLFSGTKVTDNDLERLLPKNDNGKYYLPATTLANYCYYNMFYGCTSLTTAPTLPATTLASNCYYSMFMGCTSLTTAPELPATTLASNCYRQMFYGCTSLTTAPELPATTLANYCYYSMFYGCRSLTAAPELPATTLANYCYYRMFYNCKKLNYIKMLATDISASNCLNNWVDGVSSTGTFVKNAAMTSLPTGASGIPSGWTVQNA